MSLRDLSSFHLDWNRIKPSRFFVTSPEMLELTALYLNFNMKIKVADGTILRVIEDFVDRFANIPIAGMHYDFFAKRRGELPPFMLNRRVYSNMLIQTDIPYRNEGFYNDDTDLCLRVLKDGLCTMLFYSFLVGKAETMTVKGGMTPQWLRKNWGPTCAIFAD